MSRTTKCPRCGYVGTVRSHRRVLERFLVVFKPMRCLDCQHRFLVFERLGADRTS